MASAPGRRILAAAISGCAALLALAAPAGAATNPSFPDRVPTAESARCSEIVVYASRGANENLSLPSLRARGQFEADGVTPRTKYYDGLGEELLPIYTELREKYAPGTIELVTNRAPRATKLIGGTDPAGPATGAGFRAVGVTFTPSAFYDYALSINEGKEAAIRDLTTIHERCPASKLAVLGYSAGAEVTRRALASLPWTPDPGTAMAVTFGDPTWKAGDPNLTYVGDTSRSQLGAIRATKEGDFGLGFSLLGFKIAAIPRFPAGWNATTYCHGGDLSCQWRAGLLLAHESYHEEDAVGAGARIASYLGGEFVRPVVTARIGGSAACYRRGSTVAVWLKVEGAGESDRETVKGQWEMTPFVPFEPITLSSTRPLVGRNVATGLFSRLRIEQGGHKLDYRNAC